MGRGRLGREEPPQASLTPESGSPLLLPGQTPDQRRMFLREHVLSLRRREGADLAARALQPAVRLYLRAVEPDVRTVAGVLLECVVARAPPHAWAGVRQGLLRDLARDMSTACCCFQVLQSAYLLRLCSRKLGAEPVLKSLCAVEGEWAASSCDPYVLLRAKCRSNLLLSLRT